MTSDGDKYRFSLRQMLLFTAGIAAMLALAVNLPTLIGIAYEKWRLKQFDSVLYEEPNFDLRITGLIEREAVLGLAAPSIYYRYEVRSHSFLSRWRTVCQVSIPAAETIPRGQFKSASNSAYYFFNSWMFGVTVNGGTDWMSINVDRLPLQPPTESSYLTIKSLSFQPSGNGDIVVTAIDADSGEALGSTALDSKDFGKSWSATNQVRP